MGSENDRIIYWSWVHTGISYMTRPLEVVGGGMDEAQRMNIMGSCVALYHFVAVVASPFAALQWTRGV